MKPAATGIAADYRARLADKGIKLPLTADLERPGIVLGSDGRVVAAIAKANLGLDQGDAIRMAEAFAGAVNWYGGKEKP